MTAMRSCTLTSVVLIGSLCKIIWSQLCVFQISSSDDHKFPHSILKSPAAESIVSNKQVQFFGLSSDSDISLVSIPAAATKHFSWWNQLLAKPQCNVLPPACRDIQSLQRKPGLICLPWHTVLLQRKPDLICLPWHTVLTKKTRPDMLRTVCFDNLYKQAVIVKISLFDNNNGVNVTVIHYLIVIVTCTEHWSSSHSSNPDISLSCPSDSLLSADTAAAVVHFIVCCYEGCPVIKFTQIIKT
jgi:hypothetical protein